MQFRCHLLITCIENQPTTCWFLVDARRTVRQRHIYMIMDMCTGGELFSLVTKNPGDCATQAEIKRMLIHMLSAVSAIKTFSGPCYSSVARFPHFHTCVGAAVVVVHPKSFADCISLVSRFTICRNAWDA